MIAHEYAAELLEILRRHSNQAVRTMQSVDELLPDKVAKIGFGIHPNQEPDGTFSVLVHLYGPDLYAINKAIDAHRYLFDVKYVEGALTPEVPTFDPFDNDFDVNDVIVDTALVWLEELWLAFDGEMKALPASVFGEDGYGTKTPKSLPF